MSLFSGRQHKGAMREVRALKKTEAEARAKAYADYQTARREGNLVEMSRLKAIKIASTSAKPSRHEPA